MDNRRGNILAYLPVERYKLLDVFRGIAILWIVCFHILANVSKQYGVVLSYIINHGYLGVNIFFVISGYGIATSIFGRKHQVPSRFLLRRLKRIYLPYWWYLLFAVFILPFFSSIVAMIETNIFNINIISYDLVEWLQIITLAKVFSSENWALNLAFLPLNGALWYIAIIVQIYIFLSICLYSDKYISNLLFIMFALSLLSIIPSVKSIIPHGLFVPYFVYFYGGIIIYIILHNKPICLNNFLKIFIVALSILIVLYCFYSNSKFLQISFTMFICSIFLVLHKYDNILCGLFLSKIFIFIGIFSYSLYLLHIPLWHFITKIIGNIAVFSSLLNLPFFKILVIIFMSYIWYIFFEKPSTSQEFIYNIAGPIRAIRAGMRELLIIMDWRKN